MKVRMLSRVAFLVVASLVTLGGIGVAAQNVQGVINNRTANTMTLQRDSANVTILLTPSTQVEDVQGLFHARKKEMAVTALVPGLTVQLQGGYNAQNNLVANTVKFNGKALQPATDIQAGVTPVEQQEQAQQQQIIQQQAQIQQQQAQLQKEQQEQEQVAEAAKIAANKAAIAAVNKRFGELGDHNIWMR